MVCASSTSVQPVSPLVPVLFWVSLACVSALFLVVGGATHPKHPRSDRDDRSFLSVERRGAEPGLILRVPWPPPFLPKARAQHTVFALFPSQAYVYSPAARGGTPLRRGGPTAPPRQSKTKESEPDTSLKDSAGGGYERGGRGARRRHPPRPYLPNATPQLLTQPLAATVAPVVSSRHRRPPSTFSTSRRPACSGTS